MSDQTDTQSSPGVNRPFEIAGKTIVISGGAGGIGSAMARCFHQRGAANVVIADLSEERSTGVARRIAAEGSVDSLGAVIGRQLNVTNPAATRALIEGVEADIAPIDLYCANAGITAGEGIEADVDIWDSLWNVNVMAHVHAARELVPRWIERGGGHLLVTASAAGLLSSPGDAPYSVTKHAAVALAEWISMTHGADGVGVSCLCPQGVRTPMLLGSDADEYADLPDGATWNAASAESSLTADVVNAMDIVEPDDVAVLVADALAQGHFLITPHPEVREYVKFRAADSDRWLGGMQQLIKKLGG